MRYFLFSFSVTIIIYLLVSFVRWDIAWIKDIPNWEMFARGGMVLVFVFKEILCIMVYDTIKEIKEFFSFKK